MKTRLVFTSYCRATTDTEAPGADAAATISRLSASGQTRRRGRGLVSIIPVVDTYPHSAAAKADSLALAAKSHQAGHTGGRL